MRPRDHFLKAGRIEATLRTLDREADFEMIIETCMLAATHLLNAALYVRGVTHGHSDQSHTIRPPLEFFCKPVDPDLAEAMVPLKLIEGLRPRFVRGGEAYDPDAIEKCLMSYKDAKGRFLEIIGDEVRKPAWE